MHRVLLALAATLLAAGTLSCSSTRSAEATTPDQKAVMAAVHGFVDSFNAGDAQKAIAAGTDSMSILDEFPPYEWHGSGALSKWLQDYAADAKRNGIENGVVTLLAPRHIDVEGDRAYVVATADYSFQMQGKPVGEQGSGFTFTLQKVKDAWRITGWCWSKS